MHIKYLLGAGNEIQLTDAIDMLKAEETIEAFHMTGKSHDCVDKLGYLKAFVEYGLRHPTLGKEFEAYLHSVVATSDKPLSPIV